MTESNQGMCERKQSSRGILKFLAKPAKSLQTSIQGRYIRRTDFS